MPHYLVSWEIEIDADTPLHAARLAHQIQTDKNSRATVFDVHGENGCERVDLEELAAAI